MYKSETKSFDVKNKSWSGEILVLKIVIFLSEENKTFVRLAAIH